MIKNTLELKYMKPLYKLSIITSMNYEKNLCYVIENSGAIKMMAISWRDSFDYVAP